MYGSCKSCQPVFVVGPRAADEPAATSSCPVAVRSSPARTLAHLRGRTDGESLFPHTVSGI